MAALTQKQLKNLKVEEKAVQPLVSAISSLIKEGTSRVTVVFDFLITKTDGWTPQGFENERALQGLEEMFSHRSIGGLAIFKEAYDKKELDLKKSITEYDLLQLEKLPKELTRCVDDGNYEKFEEHTLTGGTWETIGTGTEKQWVRKA